MRLRTVAQIYSRYNAHQLELDEYRVCENHNAKPPVAIIYIKCFHNRLIYSCLISSSNNRAMIIIALITEILVFEIMLTLSIFLKNAKTAFEENHPSD